MIAALLSGLSLGFGAGISPGPLTTLVITTTLARGFGAGLRVAIAPLVTDLPIIVVCIFVVNALPPWVEIALGAVGGLFVCYLGVEAIRAARVATLDAAHSAATPLSADLGRGLIVNLLSPHPWIFWMTVGSPLVLGLSRNSPGQLLLFLAGFYLLLVGSKVALAAAVAGGRRYLNNQGYRLLLAASALLLLLFGLLLLTNAVRQAL